MAQKIFRILSGVVLGLLAGIIASYGISASADAIFDKQNRGYFVSQSGSPMTLGTAGSDTFNLIASGTPVAAINQYGITMQAGKNIGLAVYVPTMAATPAVGTNDIKKGFNAIPTAAAGTAACLPAVPVAGDVFEGYNNSGAAVRVKACGTPGINGAAAGTYLTVAIATYFKCTANSATSYQCGTLAVPTPAGP